MIKLVLLFKNPRDPNTFDMRYARNLVLLKKMPGITRMQVGAVLGGPAGETPYYRILEIFFENFDALDAALTSPEGVAAGKDLMTYTEAQVELLFVEVSDALTLKPLTPENLQAYLDEHDIPAEIVHPGVTTPTVPAAARALGVEPDQIIKSVVFLVDGAPFVVYASGIRRVDPRRLADRLNVNRKVVKLADADQVLDLTGYAVGTVPPLGLKTPMAAFMDESILRHEVIYAGGGGIDALIKITPADLQRASNAEVAPMQRDDADSNGTTAPVEDE